MENMSCDPAGDLGQGGLTSAVDEILTLNPADFLSTLPDISPESSSGVLGDAMPLEDVSMATPPSDVTMTSDNVLSEDVAITSQDVSMDSPMSSLSDLSLEPAMLSLLQPAAMTADHMSAACIAMTTGDSPPDDVVMASGDTCASTVAGSPESVVTGDVSTVSSVTMDSDISLTVAVIDKAHTEERFADVMLSKSPAPFVVATTTVTTATVPVSLSCDADMSAAKVTASGTPDTMSLLPDVTVSSTDTTSSPVNIVDSTTDGITTASEKRHPVDVGPSFDDPTSEGVSRAGIVIAPASESETAAPDAAKTESETAVERETTVENETASAEGKSTTVATELRASESQVDGSVTVGAALSDLPGDETVAKVDAPNLVTIAESTSTPVDVARVNSPAVSQTTHGSIVASPDVSPGGVTKPTDGIAKVSLATTGNTTTTTGSVASGKDTPNACRTLVAADGSIITLSSNFSFPAAAFNTTPLTAVQVVGAGTSILQQRLPVRTPPAVPPQSLLLPASLPGGATSGMTQQFAGAINLTITNGAVRLNSKAMPRSPIPTSTRRTNLGMPTLISTMPSSVRLPPNLCLAAARATPSGQLPLSTPFVSGTTVMIQPAPPVARFGHQMTLVQTAGTTVRAPFMTPGTILAPGATLLAHLPGKFVPMVTGMPPRGKAPAGVALTSTSAAGSTIPRMHATFNQSRLSSAAPGRNVVSILPMTAKDAATKPVASDNRPDGGPSTSSQRKQSEASTDNPSNEGSADFDPVSVMEWKDGVGQLPGSDLKFKLNEFGVIEMVTGEDDMDSKLSVDTDEGDGIHQESQVTLPPDPDEIAADTNGICRCENCGVYGMVSEFCNGGRFCRKSCVGSFASRKCQMKHVKSSQDREKKKKRKLSVPSPDETREMKFVRIEPNKDDQSGPQMKFVMTQVPKKSRGFSWNQYLEQENAIAAPSKVFKDAFPCTKNSFKVGMKLEGIDPRHPQLYTVLSVAEVKGFRLRLHFDGFSESYDFWVNANNPFLFPAGWAEKNGKTLQPPKTYTETFSWIDYLKSSRFPAAPKHLFTNTQAASVTPHGFRIGMKLEAVDKKHTALTCVATVADVLGDRILIHFDGWEDTYDYWCDPSSHYIHPMGWCQESWKPLSPPNDWKDIDGFTWEDYLAKTHSQAVAARAFKMHPANQFEVGMKLEAVDPRNPQLIRVATIAERETYKVKIHFDGWSSAYDHWVDDDSPDIHPMLWCSRTMHHLMAPVSSIESSNQSACPTPGCTGVGHVKGAKYTGHHSSFGCPYSPLNISKDMVLQDRVGTTRSDSFDDSCSLTNVPESPDRVFRRCPTSGCDGSGHVTGKYTAHYRQSGCPLMEKLMPPTAPVAVHPLTLLNGGKPLFGPGSGRGRKKSKLLKLIKKEKELLAQGKVHGRYLTDGSHVIKKEDVDNDVDAEYVLREGIHQSVFMSAMLPSPTKDLSLCWDQHSKLLPGADQHCAADVTEWTTQKVSGFVGTLTGCDELADVFHEEQIDGEAFLLLTQTDIVKIMNVKLGPALKIYNSILIFKNNDNRA